MLPEDAGTGHVPAREAKAASDLTLPGCDQDVSMIAALTGPTPKSASNSGCSSCTTRSSSALFSSSCPVRSLTLLASFVASLRHICRLNSSSRSRHLATWLMVDVGIARRASTPRSTVLRRALRVLMAAVLSRVIDDRAVVSTLSASWVPPVRGFLSFSSGILIVFLAASSASISSDFPRRRPSLRCGKGASVT